MYRSRMPYTRWHAKAELLKEQLRQAMRERYSHLRKEESNLDVSLGTENDRSSGMPTRDLASTIRPTSGDRQEDSLSISQKIVIKAIRQQQKECQRENKRLGFGIQCERFKKHVKEQAPPPGTYTDKLLSLNIAQKSESRQEEPFTKASKVTRLAHKQISSLGPGVYEPHRFLDRSTVVVSKGRFDTSNEIRCGRIKYGYLSTLLPPQSGPRFTDFPTSVDLLQTRDYKKKGKFSLIERFPRKKMGLRIGPTKYNPRNPYEDPISFNVKQVPFLKTAERMTNKQYQAFIGNVTPFTGPGRYNISKEDKNPLAGPLFAREPIEKIRCAERTHFLDYRLRPKNIPRGWTSQPLIKDRVDRHNIGRHICLR
ncbi:hypothetical protein CSKR_101912 [Clonorchis sinensis]|uniref:Uncharacterized protein n=2 Tax=Clonorchis sinensis TaxID=79923 RepID=A0A8T1MH53_CLOSI|nr:hypothetical protein CSKR_101912 [Clonorchis sinensis]GAA36807.2 hypothetical protein CLF_104190 [Clonorchis sinensis]